MRAVTHEQLHVQGRTQHANSFQPHELTCDVIARCSRAWRCLQAGGAVSVPSSGQEEALERGRLVQMVKLQGKEIDALKVEINMLRRKGGHVYSPAPPAPASVEP